MEYDLIIIGGGAAALAAAHRAERLKKKTLIINDSGILPLGGTCVNVGCIPSKIMLHQGSILYQMVKNRFRSLSLSGQADFTEALRETREMVKRFQEKNYLHVIRSQKYVDYSVAWFLVIIIMYLTFDKGTGGFYVEKINLILSDFNAPFSLTITGP